MAYVPALNARVTITTSSVAKTFNSVTELHFDYNDGTVNILDATGSFYFNLKAITTLTYTVVAGVNGQTTVVMS